jgi:small subunit ribosomal protein S6
MSNERTGLYEGMFLFPQSATANLQEAIDHLKDILDKCGVSIINFSKWDDRRLAYEIDGNKRGVYFLVFFNAPTSNISEIERRCNQSEEIIRMMVTRCEHLPKETIEANEGAEALANEIETRGVQKSDSGKSAGSKISRKEDAPKKAPAPKKVPEVTVEATTVAKEAIEAPETAESEEVTTVAKEAIEAPETAESEEVTTVAKEAIEAPETAESEEVTEA